MNPEQAPQLAAAATASRTWRWVQNMPPEERIEYAKRNRQANNRKYHSDEAYRERCLRLSAEAYQRRKARLKTAHTHEQAAPARP